MSSIQSLPSPAASLAIPVAALLLAPAPALAAVAGVDVGTTFTVLIRENDAVAGVGLLRTIDTVSVANGGVWLVEGDTDNLDTAADSVVVRNGVLAAREGQALVAPAGTTLGSFGSGGTRITSGNRWAWNYTLDGATSSTDSGIFFDNTLVIAESDFSTAPQFTPGTPYIGFFGAKLNEANQIAIMASIDDPAINTTVDRAIVRATVNASGVLLSETVLAKEGDVLPGQSLAVADFGTGPHAWDFNDNGDVLFVADLEGTSADGAIYLNNTLIATEGGASPVSGRSWSSLSTSQRVALNNNGDWAHTGQLDGSTADDLVIIVNGALFRQEGSTPPGVAGGFALTSFGTGAIDLDDAGNVFWYGDWNDPDTARDTGIFRNDQLIVQEGVTMIGGMTLTALAGVQENFQVSADGRWLIFEGELTGGIQAAFLVEMTGSSTTYCTAGTSSNGCVATISAVGAASASFATPLTVSVAQVEGQKSGLIFYGVSGAVAFPWGTGSSFLCVKAPTQRTPAQNSGGVNAQCNGALSLDWNAFHSAFPGALGTPFQSGDGVWLQGWYRDPAASKTTNLSDGLALVVQP